MFTPVGSLLKILPKRSKMPEAILAIHIRKAFSDTLFLACSDLPVEVLKKVEVKAFKSGTLSVSAPQIVCAELSLRSGKLLFEANKVLGRRVVLRLRFRPVSKF